jgi:hypothetical protein
MIFDDGRRHQRPLFESQAQMFGRMVISRARALPEQRSKCDADID